MSAPTLPTSRPHYVLVLVISGERERRWPILGRGRPDPSEPSILSRRSLGTPRECSENVYCLETWFSSLAQDVALVEIVDLYRSDCYQSKRFFDLLFQKEKNAFSLTMK